MPLMTRQSGVRAIQINAGTASMIAANSAARALSLASLRRSCSSAWRRAYSALMRWMLNPSCRAMVSAMPISESANRCGRS